MLGEAVSTSLPTPNSTRGWGIHASNLSGTSSDQKIPPRPSCHTSASAGVVRKANLGALHTQRCFPPSPTQGAEDLDSWHPRNSNYIAEGSETPVGEMEGIQGREGPAKI